LGAAPAAWRTYTDPALGFSFSYPADAHFSSGVDRRGVSTTRLQFRIPGVEGYQGMVVRVEPNPEGRGIEQVLADLYRPATGEVPVDELLAQFEQFAVAGVAGIRTTSSEGDFSVLVPLGDRVYIFAPVHSAVATAVDPAALDLFYRVLQTVTVQSSP